MAAKNQKPKTSKSVKKPQKTTSCSKNPQNVITPTKKQIRCPVTMACRKSVTYSPKKKRPKASNKKAKKTVKPNSSQVVDTEYYSVEEVVDNSLNNRELCYLTKFENYDTPSLEPDQRLYCYLLLNKFARTQIDPDTYVESIDRNLNILTDSVPWNDFKRIFDPIAIAGQTTVLSGSVKFVSQDSLGAKTLFLKSVLKHNQQFSLHSLKLPSWDMIDDSYEEYRKQLNYISSIFPEYPHVAINFPVNIGPTFYSPPPLSSILLEPITEEMMMNRDLFSHFFRPASKTGSFNGAKVLMDSEFIQANQFDKVKFMNDEERERHFTGMNRIHHDINSRFTATVEMRQEPGIGWSLTVPHDIDSNHPLLMLTGVIRRRSVAHESLMTEGECVAFSSFIEIPGTDYCLDRREFYDFSKYIPHSCNPTCGIRLVESGNDIPDLVLYSLVDIKGANSKVISLDYFKAFKTDVDNYFIGKATPDGRVFALYEQHVDFVHCLCSNECREVVYVDKSTKRGQNNFKKTELLNSLHPSFRFGGMKLAESDKIWTIKDGKFVD